MIARPFHCATCSTIGRTYQVALCASIRLWICRACLTAWRGQ